MHGVGYLINVAAMLGVLALSTRQRRRRCYGGAVAALLPSLGLLGGVLQSLFTSKRCTFVTVQSRAADLEQLARWIAAGELRPSVEKTFGLAEVSEALSALQSGAVRGKLAVRVVD